MQVYTILASISGVTPEANYVYTPIGPYKANRIQLFDPTVKEEREKAKAVLGRQLAWQKAFYNVGRWRGLVEHAKSTWIGGADRGIARSKARLAAAKTDAERDAAQASLTRWQKNREDGVHALRARQANLEKALAAQAEWKQNPGPVRVPWDVCAKVTQGGKTRHYLLPVHIGDDVNPASAGSHHHGALNLPVRDGAITRVELLHTPDVLSKGVTAESRVLHTWVPARGADDGRAPENR